MSLLITDEQLKEAADWERRLQRDECCLSDALYMCMSSGAPVPAYVRNQYLRAEMAYQRGKHADLAEAFGIARSTRNDSVMREWTQVTAIRNEVDDFAAQGFPMTDPNKDENSAFQKTAERFRMSPYRVFELYYDKRFPR